MPLIPYVDPKSAPQEVRELLDVLPDLHVFQMVAQAPTLFPGWPSAGRSWLHSSSTLCYVSLRYCRSPAHPAASTSDSSTKRSQSASGPAVNRSRCSPPPARVGITMRWIAPSPPANER